MRPPTASIAPASPNKEKKPENSAVQPQGIQNTSTGRVGGRAVRAKCERCRVTAVPIRLERPGSRTQRFPLFSLSDRILARRRARDKLRPPIGRSLRLGEGELDRATDVLEGLWSA